MEHPKEFDLDGRGSDDAYEVRGLPTTIFVDANGVVAARHVGPLDEATIDSYLAPLLEQAAQIARTSATSSEQTAPAAADLPLAPDFTLASATGETVSLQDYRGQRNVVLVFYRGRT